MVEIVEEFKYRLEKAMSLRGKKAVDVSKATGISESVISQYRKGLISPKREKILLIADYLNVNPVWLMGLDVPMEIETFTGWSNGNYYENVPIDWLIDTSEEYYEDEDYLLLQFRQLNELGQEKLLERLDELLEVPKYRLEKSKDSKAG